MTTYKRRISKINKKDDSDDYITMKDRQIIKDAISSIDAPNTPAKELLIAEASEKIADCINYSIRNEFVTQQDVARIIGVNSSTLGRRFDIKEGNKFDIIEIEKLYDFLFVEKNIIFKKYLDVISRNEDALYFAILSFFDIKSPSQFNAIDLIAGSGSATYQLWRYSVEDDSEFVHGRIDFKVDEKSGVLHADMYQPKQNSGYYAAPTKKEGDDHQPINSASQPSKRPWIRPSSEKFKGFFFRVADMYLMILKDEANNDIRISIFPNYRIEKIDHSLVADSELPNGHKQIVHMDGFGLGIDGNNLFFSPVHMDLVDSKAEKATLEKKLDVVPEDDVPPRILKKLRKYPLIRK